LTPVPPPASPCVRVKLDYADNAGNELGSRFFLSYSGSAPSSANCVTLATDIATAWNTNIAGMIDAAYSLREVDVQDIATDTGNYGSASVDHPGTGTGSSISSNAAINVEFDIARRYRGGKPRMFFPPDTQPAMVDISHWSPTSVTTYNTDVAAFFAAIEALTVGSMGTLQHVSLSYYKGFTNIANSSGRERAVPTYRTAAVVDPVTGYSAKALVGSQRRRRASTTY
jgi:hypothetical protein